MTATQTPAAGLTPRPAAGTNHPHGSTALALGRRCPCPPCRATKNAYQRHVNRQKGYGTWRPYIDPAPTREHLQKLHADGISYNQIAEQSGVAQLTVRRIAQGITKQVRPENAEALLSLTAADMKRKVLSSSGSARRLQALVAIGWPLLSIGPHIGVHPESVARIVRQPYIFRATAEAIAAGYEQLRHLTPEEHGVSLIGAQKSRRLALRRGWPDPLWWEDMGYIDDPTFDPAAAEQELNRNAQGALHRQEISHLASFGLTSETIAERLGLHISTVRAVVHELRTGQRRDRRRTA